LQYPGRCHRLSDMQQRAPKMMFLKSMQLFYFWLFFHTYFCNYIANDASYLLFWLTVVWKWKFGCQTVGRRQDLQKFDSRKNINIWNLARLSWHCIFSDRKKKTAGHSATICAFLSFSSELHEQKEGEKNSKKQRGFRFAHHIFSLSTRSNTRFCF
jgi:hypothetical protein